MRTEKAGARPAGAASCDGTSLLRVTSFAPIGTLCFRAFAQNPLPKGRVSRKRNLPPPSGTADYAVLIRPTGVGSGTLVIEPTETIFARDVRKACLPRTPQAGRRRDCVRQSWHHGIAADGRLRGRERDPVRPWPAGGGADVDGGRLCPGLRQDRKAQFSRGARPRQCHGDAV